MDGKRFAMSDVSYKMMGTLCVNGKRYQRPCQPDYHKAIQLYNSGDIVISDSTEKNDDFHIHWVEVFIDGKILLISDRVYLANVSWDTLNEQGLIFGKKVAIDGKHYILRSLKGGCSQKDINNEWDKMMNITNDTNDIWHWYKVGSWMQETSSANSIHRVLRGFAGSRYYYYYRPSPIIAFYGFRPVLESISKDIHVFISYSHYDRKFLREIEPFLSQLGQKGINIFTDKGIEPGEEWNTIIREALQQTKIAVLLVSQNFIASKYIREVELPSLLLAAEKRGLKILWIPIGICAYEDAEIIDKSTGEIYSIKKFLAVADPKIPLEERSCSDRKKVYLKLYNEKKKQINCLNL